MTLTLVRLMIVRSFHLLLHPMHVLQIPSYCEDTGSTDVCDVQIVVVKRVVMIHIYTACGTNDQF